MKPNGSGTAISDLHASNLGQSLLTIDEVADLLKVPVSWVYDHTRRRASDRIPGFRLGKYWRFRQTDVIAWLDRQRAEQKENA